mmetsp:Transcript_29553/g.53517  ORF Transcript_29553/g.53517 Transcript_29553/m.53517 type:complete len:208 (-) Transcript_29553:310-933(-)
MYGIAEPLCPEGRYKPKAALPCLLACSRTAPYVSPTRCRGTFTCVSCSGSVLNDTFSAKLWSNRPCRCAACWPPPSLPLPFLLPPLADPLAALSAGWLFELLSFSPFLFSLLLLLLLLRKLGILVPKVTKKIHGLGKRCCCHKPLWRKNSKRSYHRLRGHAATSVGTHSTTSTTTGGTLQIRLELVALGGKLRVGRSERLERRVACP